MSNAEESIDNMEKFNEKIYEDGITWLFGHHCLECGHLTFAQHEVKELAKYFYELGYHQAEKDNNLTWEDVYEILYLGRIVMREWFSKHKDVADDDSNEIFCKEVLKRFNEQRRK